MCGVRESQEVCTLRQYSKTEERHVVFSILYNDEPPCPVPAAEKLLFDE